jgi:pimeloyl-ACP methyl ester carboxylesterase
VKLWRPLVAALSMLTLTPAMSEYSTVPPDTVVGDIAGAPFQVQVPYPWNGTLVLFSHGYQSRGGRRPDPPADAPDPVSKQWLLDHGYALAGSGYSQQGWAVEQAFDDQIALLDRFSRLGFGRPVRVVAWGNSMGGLITTGLVQLYPARFAGAIPMCGVVAGATGMWNQLLDTEFVFKTLVAPTSSLRLVNVRDPAANFRLASSLLGAAQATPGGRARLALAAAVSGVPGWYDTGGVRPPASNYAGRELGQFTWDARLDFYFGFFLRQEVERRAGGNPSWNTGVDYRRQLEVSNDRIEVQALYRAAGLDLDHDLEMLAQAPRVTAVASAVGYLQTYFRANGHIQMPVLTMHTTDDGLVLPDDEVAYADAVRAAGDAALLRQTFVRRAGHCAFTPSETLAAFLTLVDRLDSGRWGQMRPVYLNSMAATLDVGPSSFIVFKPTDLLRLVDQGQHQLRRTGLALTGAGGPPAG